MFGVTGVVPAKCRLALARALALLALFAAPAFAHDTVYYVITDALHSEVVVTDANRNVVERTRYAPYGAVLNRPLRNGPGYGGHEEDAATGLVYMQQRYYDPQTGRFLSVDPVPADSNTGTNFNRYWYAKDNPYRYTDPDGRWADTDFSAGQATRAFAADVMAHPDRPLTPIDKIIVAVGAVAVAASGLGDVVALAKGAATVDKGLSETRETPTARAGGNSNPYKGPVNEPVTAVDSDGNAIPVNKGEQIASSPNGQYQQVKDSTGRPTGTRLDKGGHAGHADPKAQAPHAHRAGVTDATGNPHLPIKPPTLKDPGQ